MSYDPFAAARPELAAAESRHADPNAVINSADRRI
jgi:hypothetical protein